MVLAWIWRISIGKSEYFRSRASGRGTPDLQDLTRNYRVTNTQDLLAQRKFITCPTSLYRFTALPDMAASPKPAVRQA